MCQSIADKSVWLQLLSFWKRKGISILVVSLSLTGCASLKTSSEGHRITSQLTEGEEGQERLNVSAMLLSADFYLSISKPSEYELFLRPDLLGKANSVDEENSLSPPSSDFYLSISKPSEYELFLRPDLLAEENFLSLPPADFYLSISKPSEYELFLRPDLLAEEDPTNQEELIEIWESRLPDEALKPLESSLPLNLSPEASSEPEHMHGMKPYHSAFHLISNFKSPVSSVMMLIPPLPGDMELPKQSFLVFTSPLDNAYILRGLNPRCWHGRGHCGVDLVTARGKGDNVRAIEDGIVLASGTRRRYGHYAIVFHKGGILSLYSHTLKDPDLEPCQPVKKKEVIAKVGKSGNARAPHLHFEMIDLDKGWQGKTDLDTAVEQMCKDKKDKRLLASIRSNLENLIFRRDLKLDPLDFIPNIARNTSKFRIATQRVQAKTK